MDSADQALMVVPIAVTFAGVTAFTTTSAALATTAVFIGNTALSLGISYGMQKLQAANLSPQEATATIAPRDPNAPWQHIYGRAATAGVVNEPSFYYDPVANTNGEQNRARLSVRVLSMSPLDAIERIWLNGELVGGRNAAGDVIAITGKSFNPYAFSKVITLASGGTETVSSAVRLVTALGQPGEATPSYFNTTDATRFPASWDHKPFGIIGMRLVDDAQQSILELREPTLLVECRGRRLYDPRNASHDVAADPSTWAWSNNASLVIADYVRAEFGYRLRADQIDWDSVVSAADVSDEQVTNLQSGTEKRFAINGVITEDTDPTRVLDDMRRATGFRFVMPSGPTGLFRIIPPGARAVTTVIPSSHFLRRGTLRERARQSDRLDKVTRSINDPGSAYQQVAVPAVKSSRYDVSRVDLNEQEFSGWGCTSFRQAQEAAQIERGRSERGFFAEIEVGPIGFAVKPGDVVQFEADSPAGMAGREALVSRWELAQADGSPVVRLELIDNADEDTLVDRTVMTIPANANLGAPGFPAAGVGGVFELADVSVEAEGVAITATWSQPVLPNHYAEIWTTTDVDLLVTDAGFDAAITRAATAGPGNTSVVFTGQPDTEYRVFYRMVAEIRAIGAFGIPGGYQLVGNVTTGTAGVAVGDIGAGLGFADSQVVVKPVSGSPFTVNADGIALNITASSALAIVDNELRVSVSPAGGLKINGGSIELVSAIGQALALAETTEDALAAIGAASSLEGISDIERIKLAGIEAGATADQTGAEIKLLYEAEANTNAFTDAEKAKLAGIDAGAQVNAVTSVAGRTGVITLAQADIAGLTTASRPTFAGVTIGTAAGDLGTGYSGTAATTPASFSADEYLQVTINGATRYIPLATGTW